MLRQHYLCHAALSHSNGYRAKATQLIRTSSSYNTTMLICRQIFTYNCILASKLPSLTALSALAARQNATVQSLILSHSEPKHFQKTLQTGNRNIFLRWNVCMPCRHFNAGKGSAESSGLGRTRMIIANGVKRWKVATWAIFVVDYTRNLATSGRPHRPCRYVLNSHKHPQYCGQQLKISL